MKVIFRFLYSETHLDASGGQKNSQCTIKQLITKLLNGSRVPEELL